MDSFCQLFCFYLLVTFLWYWSDTLDVGNTCGQVEIQEPAILGRNVTLSFQPATPGNTSGLVEWFSRKESGSWNRLPNLRSSPQYKNNSVYYLIVTSTDSNDDKLQYMANFTSKSCEPSIVQLNLTDLEGGCGLLYLRKPKSLSQLRLNEDVELGYFPAPAVIQNETGKYIRDWRRLSYNCSTHQDCSLAMLNGSYEEKLVQNNEYVLLIPSIKRMDSGTYSVRCIQDIPNGDKFTNNVTVLIPAEVQHCGELEIQEPAILGYDVTLTFKPPVDSINGMVEWYRRREDRTWNRLPNGSDFITSRQDNFFHLKVTSTEAGDGNLLYKANFTSSNCESPVVLLQLTELEGCGLIYLRKPKYLTQLHEGQDVELGYFPASAVVKNENEEESYIRDWRRFSSECATGGCSLEMQNGSYLEKTELNNEYVLTFSFNRSVGGDYSVRCTQDRPAGDKYTNNVTVFIPVPPGSPVFGRLETFDGCNDCLVGEMDEQYNVFCVTLGGSEPLNVTITVGNDTKPTAHDRENKKYYAFFYLEEKYHRSTAVCSVTNIALESPLSTSARIYVKKSPKLEMFSVPDVINEGVPGNITCVYSESRPATNISMYLDGRNGEVVLGTKKSSSQNSIEIKKLKREWNNRSIVCCAYEPYKKTNNCSHHKKIRYQFPPDKVNLEVTKEPFKEEAFHFLKATCTVYNANPECLPHWIAPQGIVIETKNLQNKESSRGGFDTLYEATFNINREHSGKTIVCESNCTNFDAMKSIAYVISFSGSEESSHENNGGKEKPSLLVIVLVVSGLIVLLVVSVALVVGIKKTRDSSTKKGKEELPPREGPIGSEKNEDEHVELSSEPLPIDALYSQVDETARFKNLAPERSQNEEAGAVQLVYAELDIEPPSDNITVHTVNKRHTPTEYVSIDFNKTAELEQTDPEETVYANQ